MTEKNILPEHFHLFNDHHDYFLRHDALHPLVFDLTFSLTKRYTCHAGCKVCYIGHKLKDGFSKFSNDVPTEITEQDEEFWFNTFKYFYAHRTNDDLTYFRINYPHLFDWYKRHAHIFEFGMTDNAFITQYNTLMNHIELKGLSDVSLSETFLVKANKDGKILKILKELFAKYNITKFKILATEQYGNHPEVTSVMDYLNNRGLENMIQHDFRYSENPRFELDEILKYQNTHVLSYNDRTYQIYRESVHLYNDRFFYSVDDASDYNWPSFYQLEEKKFVPEQLITKMLEGKLMLYKGFKQELDAIDDPTVSKFKDYYSKTQEFKINQDFNFIPDFMLDKRTAFYQQLIHNRGFKSTEWGLVKPGSKIVPLVEFK
jgi:hypothetical protein